MTKPPAKRHRKGDGRVTFLARKDLFRSLLEAGHPQRSIYDDHGADLGISYSQFNRYVTQYLIPKESTHEHQNEPRPASGHPATARSGPQPERPGEGKRVPEPGTNSKGGFAHNPKAGNDRDDLV